MLLEATVIPLTTLPTAHPSSEAAQAPVVVPAPRFTRASVTRTR